MVSTMRRSHVKAGLLDARDRATKRRRDRKQCSDSEESAVDVLLARIGEWIDEAEWERLERLDLDQYLRDTGDIDLPAEERLRQMAIEMEETLCFESTARTWAAVNRVYEEALRLAPEDAFVLHSQGISASWLAQMANPGKEAKLVENLNRTAHTTLLRAAEFAPLDGHIAYTQGLSLYRDETRSMEEALAHFDRALRLNPELAWARLYRAHCLHDLERWQDAVDAYSMVPKNEFDGPPSWRMHLLVEQRALCRLNAGDKGGALADFEVILERYEKQPHLAMADEPLANIREAADRAFPQLLPRLDALERRMKEN